MPGGAGPGGETRFGTVGANAARGETEAPVAEGDAEPPEHEIPSPATATTKTQRSVGVLRFLDMAIH